MEENQTVAEDLEHSNWTRGLWRMSTATEIAELISLWEAVSEVQLTENEDSIRWKWTASGQYSSRSAYRAQLAGSYCSFDALAIWKAKVESKHRFFAWLLVQRKILTADKLLARNWPCNPMCPLCDQENETTDHLCLHCIFAQEVWVLVAEWSDGAVHVPAVNNCCCNGGILGWVGLQLCPKAGRQQPESIRLGTFGKRGIGEFLNLPRLHLDECYN
jgi:hypothetical protein